MADHLRALSVQKVAGWYRRLADSFGRRRVGGEEPYAAILLRHWLDNRDPKSTFTIRPRSYLWNSPKVIEVLRYHRAVFLTEQEARVGQGRTKRAGVIPRIRGERGYTKWTLPGKIALDYSSLVEIGSDPLDIFRIQQSGSDEERDLFTALRGFQLKSSVRLEGIMSGAEATVRFMQWRCEIFDRYDWDYSEYLTVPNPDFGSRAAGAIRPGDRMFTVYHSNAKRLEDAQLAAPYDVRSSAWVVIRPDLLSSARVRIG